MKSIIFVLFLSIAVHCYSQNYTKKYNRYLERYEFYNSQGTLVGYQTYNPYLQQWEYTDIAKSTNSTYTYQNTQDTDLIDRVLSSKQSRYDQNVEKIRDKIKYLHNLLMGINDLQTRKRAVNRFSKVVSDFNGRNLKYDYSNNQTANQVMNYFISEYNNILSDSKKSPTYKRNPTSNRILYTTKFDNPKYKVPLYDLYGGYSIIYSCPKNSTVQVMDTIDGKYFKVIVDGKMGRVHRNSLKLGKIGNYYIID
ncbi:hypothetical protein GUA46_03965 [Muricauda sp. HICW]|uniref:Uncharacterized protein n=1 Tax=Flagellimonas chongwuensis TaxID=2697365 RepID=A0A850NGE6_9FLAO|nr:hypothetical protein [Allomuricauda chongwuensis]NVN17488.1 hypothetical protein [Allomuricauda chongwuensis]